MQHLSNCHVAPVAAKRTATEREEAFELYVAVAGMGCPNCANRVRNMLLALEGVRDAEIDLPAALATVWYDEGSVEVADVVDAVARAGSGTHHQYLGVPVPRRVDDQERGPERPTPDRLRQHAP